MRGRRLEKSRKLKKSGIPTLVGQAMLLPTKPLQSQASQTIDISNESISKDWHFVDERPDIVRT